jgi:hypothetical protein
MQKCFSAKDLEDTLGQKKVEKEWKDAKGIFHLFTIMEKVLVKPFPSQGW